MKLGLYLFFFTLSFSYGQMNTLSGVNVTDFQKQKNISKVSVENIKKQIKFLQNEGIYYVRIPFRFDTSDAPLNKKLVQKIKSIAKYCYKKGIKLVLVNFSEGLNKDNYLIKGGVITHKWIKLLYHLKKYDKIYYELLNEPNLYPIEWRNLCKQMILEIRKHHTHEKLLIGATNFNSIYELSRFKPLDFSNIIYTFHFYEPFIFTHQLTSWTQPQNATHGIPFPYEKLRMPTLNPKAKNTPGEINFKDYPNTGNVEAIKQKMGIVTDWAKKNDTVIWCTEYGVTINSDYPSRKNYLQAIQQIFKEYNIKNFAWELKGNFGLIEKNNEDLIKLLF